MKKITVRKISPEVYTYWIFRQRLIISDRAQIVVYATIVYG